MRSIKCSPLFSPIWYGQLPKDLALLGAGTLLQGGGQVSLVHPRSIILMDSRLKNCEYTMKLETRALFSVREFMSQQDLIVDDLLRSWISCFFKALVGVPIATHL